MAKEKQKRKEKTIVYPIMYDEHMIKVKRIRPPLTLDDKYPYRNQKFWPRVWRLLIYILIWAIALPVILLSRGLKIKGKKNLRKNKKLLKNGAITVANHVHIWDTICIVLALRRGIWAPGWPINFEGTNAHLIRGIGGIPVPKRIDGLRAFVKTFDTIMAEGRFVHFFAEGSMWHHFDAIRPFKEGAFKFAYKYDKPIIPMVFSYRKTRGLIKLFRPNGVLWTLHIGEPLTVNTELPKLEAIQDLLTRCRSAMHEMSGFTKLIDQNEIQRSV